MRLDFRDGQWAELRERLTYAQARDVRRASLAIRSDTQALADFDIALVRAYVSAWEVRGIDGVAVQLEWPEFAPDDIIQSISARALEVWNGQPDPKGTPAS